MTGGAAASALTVRGLEKAYGPVRALAGVDFDVRPGEVHALLGENGAGKSTLLKCLAGAIHADAGEILREGAPWIPAGPADARARGVAMIHQELALAPDLTVQQNVLLGAEPRGGGIGAASIVDGGSARERTQRALERLGRADLAPNRRVVELGPGDRQMVEVARALAGEARVLVLDEPTSSLSAADVERLFEVVRSLRDEGVAVVYVSHFLEEVREVADTYTVLRNGESVGSGRLDEIDDDGLVALMAGRAVEELFPEVERTRGEVALSVRGLRPAGHPESAPGVDLELHRGEVLGIAGLVGAGRTELLRALYGLDRTRGGSVVMLGRDDVAPTPRSSIRAGAGLLSEDRKQEGLALGLSLAVNATLSRLGTVGSRGWISARRQREAAERWFDRLHVKRASPWQPAASLSGGNQQKVALARLLHQEAELVLLDEPTRGVDVGARAEIYRLIGELAAEGRAVLMVSSYLPELLGTCDRIAVMDRGRLGAARPTSEWTEHSLLLAATGAGAAGASA